MKKEELIKILKRLYKEHVKKYLKNIFLALLLSIVVALSTSATAWLLDPAVKKVFIDKDQTLAALIPIAIILAFSSKGISLYFARSLIIGIGGKITGELQNRISKNILISDVQTLDNRHSGKYVGNMMYDCGMVQNLVSVGVLNLMKDSFTLFALTFLMFYQNWKLAIFALIMMPLAAILAKSLGKRIGKATSEAGEVTGNFASFLSEIIKGSRMIRIYQKETAELSNAGKKIDLMVDKNIKINKILIRATPIMEILTGIMIAGFIFYSGKLISSGELEVNQFFSFLAAMMLAYQPVRSLATINMTAYQGAASAKRIFAVIDEPIEVKNDDSLPPINIDKCNIEYENIGFAYKNTKERAIKNINLDIKGGTMVAFVGHSGAGKSTILNLLPRFYDPQNGEIKIDGQNIKKVNLNSLRRNISLVSQDIVLFDQTVLANIKYANSSASEQEVADACKFAAASEFIDKLPNKLNTIIGENGIKLSGGQKQRISIARAILKKSPIILLDEATSSLDAESEEIIQNAIKNLTKNKTTLVIAHRLSTILSAEKIFVIKEGNIIDAGTHEALLKKCKEYKSLYQKQLN
ncbi:ABC transporter permease [SAR11 cluster bacterium PRT-SC02]|nr:ABC transporter permease [SAR11 cluster bacterium PRT-SC02]